MWTAICGDGDVLVRGCGGNAWSASGSAADRVLENNYDEHPWARFRVGCWKVWVLWQPSEHTQQQQHQMQAPVFSPIRRIGDLNFFPPEQDAAVTTWT